MTDTIANMVDTVICGDCLEVMKDMPDNCVDSIITDPPYGLGFMGKDWDTFKDGENAHAEYKRKAPDKYLYDISTGKMKHVKWAIPIGGRTAGSYDWRRNREFQAWCTLWAKECLRIAKPGAILMAFGGSRTYHRLTCAIEDAGWEIRDCIQWIYGSGFPKSLRIALQFEQRLCIRNEGPDGRDEWFYKDDGKKMQREIPFRHPQANEWAEHGTALKPSWEPIIVAMKPLDGTFAENAEKWGVAGLWIDGGRIGYQSDADKKSAVWGRGTDIMGGNYVGATHGTGEVNIQPDDKGRFPSNTILSCTCDGEHEPDCPVRLLDEQSGVLKSGALKPYKENHQNASSYQFHRDKTFTQESNSGGASRFFYCAKASKAERNAGCEGLKAGPPPASARSKPAEGRNAPLGEPRANHHPTVKPLALMEYLCKLTKTPTGGIVLDPFAGSGSTGMAAYKTNRHYILIEKELNYCKIAEKRIQEERDKYGLFETAKGDG